MRNIYFTMTFILFALMACDNKTELEKAKVSKNNLERSAKETVNRIDEQTCNESDLECLAEKAKHNTEEGIEYIGDKSEEAVDYVD